MIWDAWASIIEEMGKRASNRDARRRLATVRAAERRAALPTPRDRAAALLWSILDRKQRRSLVKNGWFEVVTGAKHIRFIAGSLRPHQVKEDGTVVHSFCIYIVSPAGETFAQREWEDHAVGMLLLIKYNPGRFFEVAVKHRDFVTWDDAKHLIKTIKWRPPYSAT